MASEELIKHLQKQMNNTYGKYKSTMPEALKGIVDEHISLDQELGENKDAINDVRAFIETNLIDSIWDYIGYMIGDISQEAKMEYHLGEYRLSEEEKEFSERETEFRERDSEGL